MSLCVLQVVDGGEYLTIWFKVVVGETVANSETWDLFNSLGAGLKKTFHCFTVSLLCSNNHVEYFTESFNYSLEPVSKALNSDQFEIMYIFLDELHLQMKTVR